MYKSDTVSKFTYCYCQCYKKQASLIVTEKIVKELMPNSPNLRREIKNIKTSGNETEVMFVNGSSIVVVPATDNARG